MTRVRRIRHRLAAQGGYSLVELITVMAVLGTVVTSITSLFVSGTKAEVDLHNRYDVQSAAVVSMDRIRRDVHCASVAVVAGDTVTLTTPCIVGSTISWCAKGVAGRYRLYRSPSTGACSTADTPYGDYLQSNAPWGYYASTIDNLAKLKVTLSVKEPTMKSPYTLCDFLVLRNSKRENTTGETVAAC